jgi:hypothetical protein
VVSSLQVPHFGTKSSYFLRHCDRLGLVGHDRETVRCLERFVPEIMNISRCDHYLPSNEAFCCL